MSSNSTKGTKQHYLPACIIGRFSNNENGLSRDRHVQVLRRGSNHAYRAKASTLCAVNGLYDGDSFEGGTIDQWDYEQNLTTIFNQMKQGGLPDLDYYVHDLVPYVTGLFMRGPDFEKRLMRRLVSSGIDMKLFSEDTVNGDRLFELQRLLSLLLAARWSCLHPPDGMRFVLGDIDLSQTTIEGTSAWMVPVDPELALLIQPRKKGYIADYRSRDHIWIARVEHLQLHEAATERANRNSMRQSQQLCIAQQSTDFIDELPNRSLNDNVAAAETAFGITSLFTVHEMVEHEFEWYGLSRIAAEHMSPTMASRLVKNRPYYRSYPKHWKPPMPMVADNLTFFDSGVTIKKRKLLLDLSDTGDFESHLTDNAFKLNFAQIQ